MNTHSCGKKHINEIAAQILAQLLASEFSQFDKPSATLHSEALERAVQAMTTDPDNPASVTLARDAMHSFLRDRLGAVPVRFNEAGRKAQEERARKAEAKRTLSAGAERIAEPYPVDALGEILGPAAKAIAHIVDCPIELGANVVLGVAAVAAQGVANVQMRFGDITIISLFILTIAKSGERKTAADNRARSGIEGREEQLRKEYAEALPGYEQRLAAWQGERKKIVNDKKIGVQERTRLLEKLGSPPDALRGPKLTIRDGTAEGIVKALTTQQPSMGLLNSEGSLFLGGHGFTLEAKRRTVATMCLLWDDGSIDRALSGAGIIDVKHRRFSVHMMVQPVFADEFVSDPLFRGQGFLARFLMAMPKSRIGYRTRSDVEISLTHHIAMGTFNTMVQNLLSSIETWDERGDRIKTLTLTLSPEAREISFRFHLEVEEMQKPGGRFEHFTDVASKIEMQANRIAGVLTMFQRFGEKQTVPGGIMANAVQLARYYLNEAFRISEAMSLGKVVSDGDIILNWILSDPKRRDGESLLERDDRGGWYCSVREVQRYISPHELRKDNRRVREAFASLEAHRLASFPARATKGSVIYVAPR